MMSGINSKTNPTPSEVKDSSSTKVGYTAFYGNLAMYISLLSKKKNKPFNLSEFGVEISADYIWGFMEACSAIYPKAFSYSAKKDEFTIHVFDEKVLGNEALWRERIMEYANKKDAETYLKAVDSYFEDTLIVSSDDQN